MKLAPNPWFEYTSNGRYPSHLKEIYADKLMTIPGVLGCGIGGGGGGKVIIICAYEDDPQRIKEILHKYIHEDPDPIWNNIKSRDWESDIRFHCSQVYLMPAIEE